MASTFKMEPMTYRVGPKYFNERSRSGSSPNTFNARVQRKGYESATAVYGPQYMTKPTRGGKPRLTRDIIGYDASIMTRVEYRQAPAPAPAAAPATTAAPAPATTTIKQEPVKQAGVGANRGTVGSRGRGNAGVAGNAFAGNIGSVNTEEQNDDVLMPYMKNNI